MNTQQKMQTGMITKYRPFPSISLPDRQWPTRVTTQAPLWCSVDLRDGNQALAIPMSVAEKLRMFDLLVDIGFKEIEVGFPSASQIEYDFLRCLIDENRIPDDVTVQVLVQAREALIRRTFEAVAGAKNVIIHLYNSTSPAQRRVVFRMSKQEIIDIAVRGTELVKTLTPTLTDTTVTFQYSPESFSATEIEFSLEICEAVVDVWQPTVENKIILNLPATVEMATPNVHADQIEWFCRNLRQRETAIISLHTHNDRGTGIASAELGLLAGADRVEGTLFGNGERTGNVDLVTMALNLYTQGIDPHLDFSDINYVRDEYIACTRMGIHERHPYVGELVFTAFSGSHQDAISKGIAAQSKSEDALWDVPYMPLDPADLGRSYEAIIRINAQSGKGGVAYLLREEFGIKLPRALSVEFGRIINALADKDGIELSAQTIHQTFQETYMYSAPLSVARFQSWHGVNSAECRAQITLNGMEFSIEGRGNGPINAFSAALSELPTPSFQLRHYNEHALSSGSDAQAIAYIQVRTEHGEFFGVGIDHDISYASIKAIVSALNRAMQFELMPVSA